MKSKRDREEPCHICGHYHNHEAGEPCGICGHVLTVNESRAHQESVLPTQILPSFLYLGNYDTASRSELLKQFNITHILNTVPDCPVLFKNTFTYHTVTCLPPDFEECFQFLESIRTDPDGKKVLVYCMSGLSRSPTVVIAYLMKLRGWRLAESYKWVKDKRRSIQISPADTERLKQFEIQLLGQCSVPGSLDVLPVTGFDVPSPQAPTNFTAPAPTWNFSAPAASSQPTLSFANTNQPFVFGAPSAPPTNPSEAEMEM